jgi:hypothetical protein
MCEQNYINLFNPNYKSYSWQDVLDNWKKFNILILWTKEY